MDTVFCQKLNWKDIGIFLSGQIGDVVFGSFLGKKFNDIGNMKSLSYCGVAQPGSLLVLQIRTSF